jgi:hypothetical protein
MVQIFPDFVTLLKDFGVLVLVGTIAMYLVGRYVVSLISGWCIRCDGVFHKIDTLEASIRNRHSPNIVHFRTEILDGLAEVSAHIDARCGSVNCPIVPVVNEKLSSLSDRFEREAEHANQSRQETQDLVKQIFDRLTVFSNETMREVISVLRDRRDKT